MNILLKDDGVLVLAVPDKRFCFDVLRPRTSTGTVLQAHLEKHRRHAIGKVFDEIAYSCLREGALAWSRSDTNQLSFYHPHERAREFYEMLQTKDIFIDIHAWQFTPSSFRLIIYDLYHLGVCRTLSNSPC